MLRQMINPPVPGLKSSVTKATTRGYCWPLDLPFVNGRYCINIVNPLQILYQVVFPMKRASRVQTVRMIVLLKVFV